MRRGGEDKGKNQKAKGKNSKTQKALSVRGVSINTRSRRNAHFALCSCVMKFRPLGTTASVLLSVLLMFVSLPRDGKVEELDSSPAFVKMDVRGRRPKIGLALSGGGARGFAHIGVLKVLEEMRIPRRLCGGHQYGQCGWRAVCHWL